MPSEIRVTLPDGSEKRVPAGSTGADLAKAIGPGLAKAALAARVNGHVWDLSRPLPDAAKVSILTDKDPQALEVLRHSSAHVLATAVRQLFPHAQIGFGPPIEDGFYYDFAVERPFGPEDLAAIEKKMGEVVQADYPFVREEVDRAEAKRRFKDDPLKLERIEDLGPNEVISVYTDGPFVDLCRGPHVPSTGRIKHFKLLNAAGAYWRGDERRQMLQRIYGTAWFTKDDLEGYLRRLEEARKRDHRVLGKQLDLYSIQEDVGPGLVFWHPKGAMIQHQLRRFIEDTILERGYSLVYTPNVTREELFLRSGHLPLYAANQFPPMAAGEGEAESVRYRVKPMNCPMHILIYASQQRSYRDLPVRQIAVTALLRGVDEDVHRAIHRLHPIAHGFRLSFPGGHGWELVRRIEREVSRAQEQLLAGHVGRVDQRIATLQDRVLDEAAQLVLDHRALRVPEHQPRAHVLLDRIQVELFPQHPVVALPGLLEAPQVALEVVLGEPGRSVDALQHLAALVAPPIGAGGVEQLEVLDPPGARHVRPAAQVHERTVGVDRDHLVRPEVFDALELERVILEAPLRFRAIHLLAHERVIGLHDLPHLLFDRCEILRPEGPLHREVVVEPVLDRGTESDLRLGEQLPHRRRQHVGRRVAQHLQRRRVLVREDRDLRRVGQRARQVPDVAVHPRGERRLREPRPDGLGEVGARGTGRDTLLAPVGERDANFGGHETSWPAGRWPRVCPSRAARGVRRGSTARR